jgi:hypothetical protein
VADFSVTARLGPHGQWSRTSRGQEPIEACRPKADLQTPGREYEDGRKGRMINGADGGEEINVHPLREELWLTCSSVTTEFCCKLL